MLFSVESSRTMICLCIQIQVLSYKRFSRVQSVHVMMSVVVGL